MMKTILARFEGGPLDGEIIRIKHTLAYEYDLKPMDETVTYIDNGPYMGVDEDYRLYKTEPSFDEVEFTKRYNQFIDELAMKLYKKQNETMMYTNDLVNYFTRNI